MLEARTLKAGLAAFGAAAVTACSATTGNGTASLDPLIQVSQPGDAADRKSVV